MSIWWNGDDKRRGGFASESKKQKYDAHGEIFCDGHFYKEGSSYKSWTYRQFDIHENNVMVYYDTKSVAKGELNLNECTVTHGSDATTSITSALGSKSTGREFALDLFCPVEDRHLRIVMQDPSEAAHLLAGVAALDPHGETNAQDFAAVQGWMMPRQANQIVIEDDEEEGDADRESVEVARRGGKGGRQGSVFRGHIGPAPSGPAKDKDKDEDEDKDKEATHDPTKELHLSHEEQDRIAHSHTNDHLMTDLFGGGGVEDKEEEKEEEKRAGAGSLQVVPTKAANAVNTGELKAAGAPGFFEDDDEYSDDSEREEENEKQDTLGSASGPIVSRVPFGNADSQPRGDRGDSNSEGGNGNKSKRVSFLPVVEERNPVGWLMSIDQIESYDLKTTVGMLDSSDPCLTLSLWKHRGGVGGSSRVNLHNKCKHSTIGRTSSHASSGSSAMFQDSYSNVFFYEEDLQDKDLELQVEIQNKSMFGSLRHTGVGFIQLKEIAKDLLEQAPNERGHVHHHHLRSFEELALFHFTSGQIPSFNSLPMVLLPGAVEQSLADQDNAGTHSRRNSKWSKRQKAIFSSHSAAYIASKGRNNKQKPHSNNNKVEEASSDSSIMQDGQSVKMKSRKNSLHYFRDRDRPKQKQGSIVPNDANPSTSDHSSRRSSVPFGIALDDEARKYVNLQGHIYFRISMRRLGGREKFQHRMPFLVKTSVASHDRHNGPVGKDDEESESDSGSSSSEEEGFDKDLLPSVPASLVASLHSPRQGVASSDKALGSAGSLSPQQLSMNINGMNTQNPKKEAKRKKGAMLVAAMPTLDGTGLTLEAKEVLDVYLLNSQYSANKGPNIPQADEDDVNQSDRETNTGSVQVKTVKTQRRRSSWLSIFGRGEETEGSALSGTLQVLASPPTGAVEDVSISGTGAVAYSSLSVSEEENERQTLLSLPRHSERLTAIVSHTFPCSSSAHEKGKEPPIQVVEQEIVTEAKFMHWQPRIFDVLKEGFVLLQRQDNGVPADPSIAAGFLKIPLENVHMQLEERGCAVLGNKKWVGTAEGHMHSKEEIKSGVHHSHLHRKKSDVQVRFAGSTMDVFYDDSTEEGGIGNAMLGSQRGDERPTFSSEEVQEFEAILAAERDKVANNSNAGKVNLKLQLDGPPASWTGYTDPDGFFQGTGLCIYPDGSRFDGEMVNSIEVASEGEAEESGGGEGDTATTGDIPWEAERARDTFRGYSHNMRDSALGVRGTTVSLSSIHEQGLGKAATEKYRDKDKDNNRPSGISAVREGPYSNGPQSGPEEDKDIHHKYSSAQLLDVPIVRLSFGSTSAFTGHITGSGHRNNASSSEEAVYILTFLTDKVVADVNGSKPFRFREEAARVKAQIGSVVQMLQFVKAVRDAAAVSHTKAVSARDDKDDKDGEGGGEEKEKKDFDEAEKLKVKELKELKEGRDRDEEERRSKSLADVNNVVIQLETRLSQLVEENEKRKSVFQGTTTASLTRVYAILWVCCTFNAMLLPTPMTLFLYSILTGGFVAITNWAHSATGHHTMHKMKARMQDLRADHRKRFAIRSGLQARSYNKARVEQ